MKLAGTFLVEKVVSGDSPLTQDQLPYWSSAAKSFIETLTNLTSHIQSLVPCVFFRSKVHYCQKKRKENIPFFGGTKSCPKQHTLFKFAQITIKMQKQVLWPTIIQQFQWQKETNLHKFNFCSPVFLSTHNLVYFQLKKQTVVTQFPGSNRPTNANLSYFSQAALC